jgi:hypothetical protein
LPIFVLLFGAVPPFNGDLNAWVLGAGWLIG